MTERHKAVEGILTLTVQHERGIATPKFLAKGGFVHDRFLRMNYHRTDEPRVQFGSMILELDDHSKRLVGKLVGYGPYSKGIVEADISLEKNS